MHLHINHSSDPLLSTIKKYCIEQSLFKPGDKIVLAVSGGSDSIALLHLFITIRSILGIDIIAAHLDHRLRGDESDTDRHFVCDEAKRMDIAYEESCSSVRDNKKSNESLEMAARRLRYHFFRQVMLRHGCNAIATGHTLDDQAETVLMRLIRGTSLRGAGGIRPVSHIYGIRVIHPLLPITRQELRVWLKTRGIQWRDDSSNNCDMYQRNRIRHEIIPLISTRLNSSAKEHIVTFSSYAREDDEALNQIAEQNVNLLFTSDNSDRISSDVLNSYSPAIQRRMIIRWLEKAKPSAIYSGFLIQSVIDLSRGSEYSPVDLGNGAQIAAKNGFLQIVNIYKKGDDFSFNIGLKGIFKRSNSSLVVTTGYSSEIIRDNTHTPGLLPAKASFRLPSEDEITYIIVRNVRNGDRIKPLGMKGSRKLQDIFVDFRILHEHRHTIPLLVYRDQVIWVPGYRIASDWAVKDSSTTAWQVTFSLE